MRAPFKCGQYLILALIAVGLAACLTSDPPKLDREDLAQVSGLAGNYTADSFPQDASDQPKVIDARIKAQDDGSYFLTLVEGDHTDAPVRLRFLTLNGQSRLCVLTETDPDSGDSAMYARVSRDPDGTWIFKIVDLARHRRNERLTAVVGRYGVEKITFATHGSKVTDDHLHGTLDARQLRNLFSDPAFARATQMDTGFILTPRP